MQKSQTEGALAGIRVIDLTRVLAGPSCTQILGDHGADVIKVEPPLGDETRTWGPPFLDGTASYFLGINRNKRGITLDLASDAGRDTLFALLEDADILVENFKTGTLEKWGLGFADVLQKRFPRVIYCRISGFGADGPLGGLPGYDAAVQAMTGLISVNGEGDRDPVRMGVPVVDLAAGLNAVIGILLALHERARSGHGQFVESTLYDSGIALLHPQLPNFYLSGKTPVRLGSAHPNISPYDTFHTKTIPIFLAVGNDVQFRKLCGLLDCPDIADDARFKSNKDRNANRDALRAALEGRLLEHECEPLADMLLRAGVPCGPVLNLDQVAAHPHTKHRDMIVDVGGVRGTGAPIKLGRTPARYKRRPPKLGEHNAEVLGSLHGRERK